MNQPAAIVADAFPDRTYQGYVVEMAPEANRQKATLQVKVRIRKPDGLIRSEMNAKVTFLEPPAGPGGPARVLVPKEAVLTREGHALVYVLTVESVASRRVRIGDEVDGRVEILDGLAGGESVVVRGAEVLREGQRVRVKR
jgi:HlyD family secretion protein